MKILFILIISLSMYNSLSAQVYRLRAFQAVVTDNADPKKVSESDWEKRDIIVVINYEKSKVQTYGNEPTDIDLINKTEEYKDENNSDVIAYKGIAKKGEKVYVTLVVYATGVTHVATLILDYYELGYTISFRLKKDE